MFDFELGHDIGEDVIGLDTSLGRRKSICPLGGTGPQTLGFRTPILYI